VKNVYAAELAGVRRDLQNDKRWKYDELPPVQSLEKLKRDQYLAHKEIAQSSATASAALFPRDREPVPFSLLKILRWCRTAYRLGVERSQQRRELMEMDDRQLRDIGVTRAQAEWQAHKPIWKS
jgi:uncharacterized protein YjiS (DUF1127 family)